MTFRGFVAPWLRTDIAAVFVGSLLLYGLVTWFLAKRGIASAHLAGFGTALAVTVAIGLAMGWQGATWDLWSRFIKTSALIAGFAIPLWVAAVMSRSIRSAPLSTRLLIGVVIGVVVSMFMPLFWLSVVCGALSDCL
jgi:hypothetical protein